MHRWMRDRDFVKVMVLRILRNYANVVAICRHRSSELEALGVRIESGFDISEPSSWSAIASCLEKDEIDLLIHNAGIASLDAKDRLDLDAVLAQFWTNAVAPLFLTRALAPRLASGAKVALISSRMGSMATIHPEATTVI